MCVEWAGALTPKLTMEQAHLVHTRRQSGEKVADLADELGVSTSCISYQSVRVRRMKSFVE